MASFELTEWVTHSPQDVFEFIGDPRNASKVMESVTLMEKLTDGPAGVGTRYREVRVMDGNEAEQELEIVAYEPGKKYAMLAEREGIKVTYHYTLNAENDGTRIDLVCDVEASGLKKMMAPMVAQILKKEDGDHLTRIKAAMNGGTA